MIKSPSKEGDFMLRGIDISSWQSDLDLNEINVDFAIVKATQGTGYVSPSCDKHVQQAIKSGKLFGYYHFADGADPKTEASFFRRATIGYEKQGIPVLDFETDIANPAQWCEQWIQEYYNLTGTWPMLYISASRCPNFANSWIPSKCGLWIAGYPIQYQSYPNTAMPYDPWPWANAAIWQFSDCLMMPGYVGNIDGDIAYMDKSAWARYAGNGNEQDTKPTTTPSQKPDYDSLVLEIWLGEWGNGDERKRLLTKAGYDYAKAQDLVNKYVRVAQECIRGLWGNGLVRQMGLEQNGFVYETVQRMINDMMG